MKRIKSATRLENITLDDLRTEFQTAYNYNEADPVCFEHPTGESCTIPEQAMSIQVLLERHAKGLPLTVQGREEYYFGDEEMPEVEKMDFAERRALSDYLHTHTKALKELLTEAEKKRQAEVKSAEATAEKLKAEQLKKAIKEAQQDAD